MSTINAEIGERVHRVMWSRRITQTAMAERLELSQSSMSRKLRGERPWDADDVLAVANALDVSVDYLFFGEPDPDPVVRTGRLSTLRPRRELALAA